MTEPSFTWDDSFLIGIDELDYEHRSLIDDINRLHRDLAEHAERTEIERCLGEIFARMQAHFALEERVMRDNDYPGYIEHKREHEALLEGYTESMMTFINNPDGDYGGPVDYELEQWILHHIRDSDRRMSAMIAATK